jgi:hypothetical protein
MRDIFPSGFSSYSYLFMASDWKVLSDPSIDPPIQALYFLWKSATKLNSDLSAPPGYY